MTDAQLRETARLIHEAEHLTSEQRRKLAEAAERLADALKDTSPEEAARLSAATSALLAAVHQDSPLDEHRSQLEEAIIAAETRAPVATGFARQLIDALANLGI